LFQGISQRYELVSTVIDGRSYLMREANDS
jgi:hypothetical protein